MMTSLGCVVFTEFCLCVNKCFNVAFQMEAVPNLVDYLWQEYEWALTIAGNNTCIPVYYTVM